MMTTKFRKPTKDEEIAAWRALAWEINLHRTLTMDHRKVVACLERMDSYVASHRDGNGSIPDPEVNQNVWGAFWTHIANKPEDGLKKR
jgi:hypothetical protein